MEPFYEANKLIHDLLGSIHLILDIGLDDYFIEGWLYISFYPLVLPPQDLNADNIFNIQIFRFDSETSSLKIISLKYQLITGSNIEYMSNSEFDDSINELAKKIIDCEVFLRNVKPLLLQGFREIALKKLID